MRYSLKDFTLFAIEQGIFIAIPVEDDGKFDAKIVYLVGKQAVKEYALFDLV